MKVGGASAPPAPLAQPPLIWKNECGRGTKDSCYIRLKTKPECYFFILHSQQCFNLFIELAGLFKQIVKVLLGH